MRRPFLSSFVLAATALSAPLCVYGCSGGKPTEIMLSVQTDVRVPKDLDHVQFVVSWFGKPMLDQTYEVGPKANSLPATLGVVPIDKDNKDPFDVTVVGYFGARKRVIRKARISFGKGRVALVPLPLRFSCFDKADCDEGKTCIAGECQPIPTIDGANQPEYVAPKGLGTFDDALSDAADGASNCYDEDKCLATVTALTATSADACDFDASALGSNAFTVAIETDGATGVGTCSATSCRLPVDFDAEGWQWVSGAPSTLRLVSGLCAKMKAVKGRLVVSTLCGRKTLETPSCPVASYFPDASVPDSTQPDTFRPDTADSTVVDVGDAFDGIADGTEVADGPSDVVDALDGLDDGKLVCGAVPPGAGVEALVDDFEGSTLALPQLDGRQGTWSSTVAPFSAAAPTAKLLLDLEDAGTFDAGFDDASVADGAAGNHYLGIAGTLDATQEVTLSLNFNNTCPYNAGTYAGLSFFTRGEGMLEVAVTDRLPGENNDSVWVFPWSITLSPSGWLSHVLDFRNGGLPVVPLGDGATRTFEPAYITGITFTQRPMFSPEAGPRSVNIAIDNVRFETLLGR